MGSEGRLQPRLSFEEGFWALQQQAQAASKAMPWLPSPLPLTHTLQGESVPWKGRTTGQETLHTKQYLLQTLLVSRVRGPRHWPPGAIVAKD